MRWLLIVFLVSLGTLLLAAGGVARHIWLHRNGSRTGNQQRRGKPGSPIRK